MSLCRAHQLDGMGTHRVLEGATVAARVLRRATRVRGNMSRGFLPEKGEGERMKKGQAAESEGVCASTSYRWQATRRPSSSVISGTGDRQRGLAQSQRA